MGTKILLINFTDKQIEDLQTLPVNFDRGFISDKKWIKVKSNDPIRYDDTPKKQKSYFNSYFPLPVYEYNAVFINLNHNKGLEDEFAEKAKKFTTEDGQNFGRHWFIHAKPMVVFLGNYSFYDLSDIGILGVNLIDVKNKDTALKNLSAIRDPSVASVFHGVKSEVKMPTQKYIRLSEGNMFDDKDSNHKLNSLYQNNNNEDLAMFATYTEGYSSYDKPRFILLPQFKNNSLVIEKTLRLFGRIYPQWFPELPSSDWIDTDAYYPFEVAEYDRKIDLITKEAKVKIKNLKKKKVEAKNKYKSLRGLLTQTGDDLKDSVIDVLDTIFGLEVSDADQKKKNLPNEDIIISNNGVKILAEVKGTKRQNPSPQYFTQVWKHVSQSKKSGIDKDRGALILNHDMETDPRDRNLAYEGEYEDSLKDIIFIDTRVLFELALAVIDYGLPQEKAKSILLQDGRVSFDFKEYLEKTAKS